MKETIAIGFGPDKMISIRLNGNCDDGVLRIYNTNGQLLTEQQVLRGLFFDMMKYPAGLYVLEVNTAEGRKTNLVNTN